MKVTFTLSRLLALARTRNGLLVVAGLLLVLNLIRLANAKYVEIRQGVENKQALLEQYRMSSKDIASLRTRIQQVETRKGQFESHLFPGNVEKDVTSAMQIKLQDALGRTGLTPESLSPAPGRGGKDAANPYGEVQVKLRLGGNLENFLKFMAELSKMDTLFVVDNVTIKPFKKDELKIFLELRGFYRLAEPAKEAVPAKKEAAKKQGEPGKKGGSRP